MDGLLLVDKPAGISSFDVVRQVRRVAGTRKVGHTGTLDPLATGLLPIVIGKCTRLARFLTLDVKGYDFEMRLGRETSSGDAEGEIVRECAWEHISEEMLLEVLWRFRGDIEQVPPAYSAIKIDGKRAYERARAGETVELKARAVHIAALEMTDCELPTARFSCRCSAGTYIRSLARDIGDALDSCAFTTAIRRTQVGPFSLAEATSLEAISAENIGDLVLSPAQMMRGVPQYVVSNEERRAIAFGQRLVVALVETMRLGDQLAVVDGAGELVAVAEVETIEGAEAVLKPVRVLISA